MNNPRTKILEAAVKVFMRYGVGRTRMGDIAKEAGVVRQTLYSFFKSKDEILCASIRHFSEQSLSELQLEWAKSDRIEEQLDVYFEQAILWSYSIISASADARDMIGGYNDAGRAETNRAQAEKVAAWTELLSQHKDALDRGKISAENLAELIVLGSIGLRDHARDESQLRSSLTTLKSSISALLA